MLCAWFSAGVDVEHASLHQLPPIQLSHAVHNNTLAAGWLRQEVTMPALMLLMMIASMFCPMSNVQSSDAAEAFGDNGSWEPWGDMHGVG